jgi:hypothetical protein
MVLDDFEHSGATKALEWFCRRMRLAPLGKVERIADIAPHRRGEIAYILLATAYPSQRFECMMVAGVLSYPRSTDEGARRPNF